MNNETKYTLKLKVKELLLETNLKSIEELLNSEKISLNVSKIMQLIYSHNELTYFFEKKINAYKELKQDNEKYIETLECMENQIAKIQPYIPFTIKTKNSVRIEYFNMHEFYCRNKYAYDSTFDDFIIRLCDRKNEFYDSSIKNHIIIDRPYGIFEFIEFLTDAYIYDNCDDDYLHLFNAEWITDEYKNNIVEYYDYYYLYNIELLYKPFFNFANPKIYMLMASNKVLNDILEFLHSIDLSEEEKIEYNINYQLSTKRIYFDDYEELKELTTAQRNLLEYIAISKDLDDLKRILKIMNNEYEHLNQTINSYVTEYFKSRELLKKGGYDAIKRLLRVHPEWFKPKSIQK